MPPVVNNRGRFQNKIAGIQGVASGANALLNLPTNRRYHRLTFNVTNNGAVASVATVLAGITLVVNGTPVRTITPQQAINIAQAQGYYPKLGELPIFFSEPYTRATMIEPGDTLSFDMEGQQTFDVQFVLNGGLTNPTITGWYEYDHLRNRLPNGELFLSPVTQHKFNYNLAAGLVDITTVPFDQKPIRRIWFDSTNAGEITALEIVADGNKIVDSTLAQMKQHYNQYGFLFQHEDRAPYQNATGPANLALDADLEAITNFDYAYISDPDYRTWKALRVARELIIRPTLTNAQAVTLIVEYLPGGYL
jgi:hypothetical protein